MEKLTLLGLSSDPFYTIPEVSKSNFERMTELRPGSRVAIASRLVWKRPAHESESHLRINRKNSRNHKKMSNLIIII